MNNKKIILNLNGIELEFDTCKDAADYLSIAPSNFSKIYNDGKEHTVKQLKFLTYPSPNFSEYDDNIEWNCDKNGKKKFINENVERFFETDPRYAGKFAINDFNKSLMYDGRDIDTNLEGIIETDVSKFFDVKVDKYNFLERRIVNIAEKNHTNPVLDKIKNANLDEILREIKIKHPSFEINDKFVEEFFIFYVGAKDTPLNRHLSKMFFYNAYRRLVEPGCDCDNVFILYDKAQGTGKTKIFQRLTWNMTYEVAHEDSNKDMVDAMMKNWLGVYNELTGTKQDMNLIKQFTTKNYDDVRLSYRRNGEKFYRHNVFIATTNNEHFLRDYSIRQGTLERRFQIVECEGIPRTPKWWDENLSDEIILAVWKIVEGWYNENKLRYDLITLPVEFRTELSEIQKTHKSSNSDIELQGVIGAITNGEFRTNKSNLTSRFKLKKDINNFINGNDTPYDNPVKLEMIPVEWCEMIFKKTKDYLFTIFEKYDWERKEILYYDDIIQDCFVKKGYKFQNSVVQQIKLVDDETDRKVNDFLS